MRFCLGLFLFCCFQFGFSQSPQTAFEKSGGSQSFTYQEGIAFCKKLDSLSEYISLFEYGKTDAGFPLHLLVFDADKSFIPQTEKEVILINNAIHPGEPDGVEASLMMLRDIALNKEQRLRYRGARILIIPFYNIGGSLNRNSHSRANQVGPEEYGFRGNAKNLDLNRDFIKADAQNTFAFYRIFHTWNPHVFVDTHVSNGADYTYTMTLINSQEEKYGSHCASLLQDNFLPQVYSRMQEQNQEMIPYVNVHGTVPDSGIMAFMESPRYSNGYTSLFDCFSFVSETHMLKAFESRVVATKQLLEQIILTSIATRPSLAIKKDRQARSELRKQEKTRAIPYIWEYQMPCDSILFKGYSAAYKPSEVSGLPRLYYDRNKPYQKQIPFCDEFLVSGKANSVRYYIIPQAWQEVIRRLAANGVKIDTLKQNDTIKVNTAKIDSYQTGENAYEGHYPHSNTQISWTEEFHIFRAGDFVITPDEKTENFLVNVLWPSAPDSYFNWNFFDPILQQKEWFSSYVFEDIAAEILENDSELKRRLEDKKSHDDYFAQSAFEQLYFVYQNCQYFETAYRKYPVYTVNF